MAHIVGIKRDAETFTSRMQEAKRLKLSKKKPSNFQRTCLPIVLPPTRPEESSECPPKRSKNTGSSDSVAARPSHRGMNPTELPVSCPNTPLDLTREDEEDRQQNAVPLDSSAAGKDTRKSENLQRLQMDSASEQAGGSTNTPTRGVEITSDDENTEDDREMEALWNVFSGRCARVLKSHHVPYSALKRCGRLAGSTMIESIKNCEKHISAPVGLVQNQPRPKPVGNTLSLTSKRNPSAPHNPPVNGSGGFSSTQAQVPRPKKPAKKKPRAEWSDPSWMLVCGIDPMTESPRCRSSTSECYFYNPIVKGRNSLGNAEQDDIGIPCVCTKLAGAETRQGWVISTSGFELARKWHLEMLLRAPSTYNTLKRKWEQETSLYPPKLVFRVLQDLGSPDPVIEVMENIFVDFEEANKKKDPFAMWARVEVIAWFLNSELYGWPLIRDIDQKSRCIMLLGTAILTTIQLLIQKKLFSEDEPIVRNLGLVLAMLLYTVADHAHSHACHDPLCEQNENGWAAEIIKLAKQHKVNLPGKPFDTLDVQGICDKKTMIEGERDAARVARHSILANGIIKNPSPERLEGVARLEGKAPGARGSGRQT